MSGNLSGARITGLTSTATISGLASAASTTFTVNDPQASTGSQSDWVQVQNTSLCSLAVTAAAGAAWTISPSEAATIPLPGTGTALSITATNPTASSITATISFVWGLHWQIPPQPDGPLTAVNTVTIAGTPNVTITGPLDGSGNVKVAIENTPTVTFAAVTNANTAGNATSLHVKSSAGTLWGCAGYSSISQYVQLLDASSLSSGTTVPVLPVFLQAAGSWSLDYEDLGRPFATGIFIAYSSTETVFTTGTAGWIDAQYT